MEQVAKFLKEADTYYLATVEGDQPRVRPFGTAHILKESSIFRQASRRLFRSRFTRIRRWRSAHLRMASGCVSQANLLRMTAERRDSRCSTHIHPCRRCTLQMMATQKYFISRMRQLHFLHLHRNRRL